GDHRRNGPALDLLRWLLDAVHAAVAAVDHVDDPLRDQIAARLAARDELREAVCGPAGGGDAKLQLLRLVAESRPGKPERDHIVVVSPPVPVVVRARPEPLLASRERADPALGEELVREEEIDEMLPPPCMLRPVEEPRVEQPTHVGRVRLQPP